MYVKGAFHGGPFFDDRRYEVARISEVCMPVYVFRCVKCDTTFEKTMTVAQREKAKPVCTECKGRKVVPVLGGFFAKTSRKS
jgi:putative FmdB family regulatory protein